MHRVLLNMADPLSGAGPVESAWKLLDDPEVPRMVSFARRYVAHSQAQPYVRMITGYRGDRSWSTASPTSAGSRASFYPAVDSTRRSPLPHRGAVPGRTRAGRSRQHRPGHGRRAAGVPAAKGPSATAGQVRGASLISSEPEDGAAVAGSPAQSHRAGSGVPGSRRSGQVR